MLVIFNVTARRSCQEVVSTLARVIMPPKCAVREEQMQGCSCLALQNKTFEVVRCSKRWTVAVHIQFFSSVFFLRVSEWTIIFTNIWNWCSRPPSPVFKYQLCYVMMQGSRFSASPWVRERTRRESEKQTWSKNTASRVLKGHQWGTRACVLGKRVEFGKAGSVEEHKHNSVL